MRAPPPPPRRQPLPPPSCLPHPRAGRALPRARGPGRRQAADGSRSAEHGQASAHSKAALRSWLRLELPAKGEDPLTHAHDPVPRSLGRLAVAARVAPPVVLDLNGQPVALIA